ncbi:hypothetical protein H0H93_006559 [Arthromyces matolae]|nr:hypothetical protein H0H93_006559 [Arthromyces matolae]
MLYRFREAQAAELGLGTRADRRPRMASACKSLRECERWRGEILREISRKVSKIQDAGLSDYEVRDLNDEINKILREKRHWENQIVALGGANYRRNVAMLDDDGKEVPGTKGYKFVFLTSYIATSAQSNENSKKSEEEEENQAFAFYKKFMNQGPSYFGDLDENDGRLLAYERSAEEEDWEDAYSNLRESLGISTDEPIPKLPRSDHTSSPPLVDGASGAHGDDVDMASPDGDSNSKQQNQSDGSTSTPTPLAEDPAHAHAAAAASYIPFLRPEDLLPPKLPTRQEMETVLLALRKKALLEEYFGEEKTST